MVPSLRGPTIQYRRKEEESHVRDSPVKIRRGCAIGYIFLHLSLLFGLRGIILLQKVAVLVKNLVHTVLHIRKGGPVLYLGKFLRGLPRCAFLFGGVTEEMGDAFLYVRKGSSDVYLGNVIGNTMEKVTYLRHSGIVLIVLLLYCVTLGSSKCPKCKIVKMFEMCNTPHCDKIKDARWEQRFPACSS